MMSNPSGAVPSQDRLRRRSLRASILRWCAALLVLSALIGLTPAAAQNFPNQRPIRIEGYWGRTKADPKVIGEVTISADGKDRRTFGVTAVQAYKPEEEGMQLFRHSSLQPITLLLRGQKKMIDRLYAAKPDQKVTMLGVYGGGSGTLTLGSVEVAGD